MNLSREQLVSGYFQNLAASHAANGRPVPLTEQQLEDSLQMTLAAGPDAGWGWIFGYGSLIWNPLFEFDAQENATLYGYRRRFCLKTELSRGTPECPGLVLGLVPGGSCEGIAYRISGNSAEAELRLLWRREMVTGAYQPRWVKVHGAKQALWALTFVMNRSYPFFVGNLSLEATAAMLATARGPLGSSAEYLFKTYAGLAEHGIPDHHLAQLVKRVRALGTIE